jgi:GNAT superfamily N-acetyltransferase
VKVETAFWDDPDVQRLTAAQQVEIRARYGGKEEPGTKPSATDVSVVLVAREDDGTALGCGALRHLGDGPDGGMAEIKRMYVTPEARGRGISKAVLAGLEQAAAERGWTTLRLETGPMQPEAIALYTGAGYRPIEAFGAYAGDPDATDSLFFQRVVSDAEPISRVTGPDPLPAR